MLLFSSLLLKIDELIIASDQEFMEFLRFGELLVAGFQSAFNNFQQQQENRFMALSADVQEKIDGILQSQQSSDELTRTILSSISEETTQVTTAFNEGLDQLKQALVEKDGLLQQALGQIEDNKQEKADILSALDGVKQKEDESINSLQIVNQQIGNIFTPPTATPDSPAPSEVI